MSNSIDSAQRRERSHETEDAKPVANATTEKAQKQGHAATPSYAYHPSQDAAIRAFVTTITRETGTGAMFVGGGGDAEKDAVAALRRDGTHVEVVAHAKKEDTVRLSGHDYNLATEKGRAEFGAVLRGRGLTPDQAKEVISIIARADPGMRDEIAHLAMSWAKAECGGTIPNRLVLAGGNGMLDGRSRIHSYELQHLARVMPRAAAQIERIEIHNDDAAVHAEIKLGTQPYYGAFPSLKSLETVSRFERSSAVRA